MLPEVSVESTRGQEKLWLLMVPLSKDIVPEGGRDSQVEKPQRGLARCGLKERCLKVRQLLAASLRTLGAWPGYRGIRNNG